MHVLVAPDKFKGSLSAADVAGNVARGARAAGASTSTLPLADGGDGSVDAALSAGFAARNVVVAGALGDAHQATIAVDDDTVVVELANTCGMATLPGGRLAPLDATTVGLGQAIAAALTHRPRRLVLALGGSASTDGGLGVLRALGLRFDDARGLPLVPSARALGAVDRISGALPGELSDVEIVIASDVTNPLTGPAGAAAVYGPQKGADPATVELLDRSLDRYVQALARNGFPTAPDIASMPGAGAAGGTGFAAALLGGVIVSGAEFFLDLLDFDEQAAGADLVITGEGSIDGQTAQGKLLSMLTRRAAPTPVVAVAGRNLLEHSEWSAVGLERIYALTELTDADTAHDAELTARLLEQLGGAIVRDFS